MNAVLDDQATTALLEALDFEVPCEVTVIRGKCTEPADYQMECVGCGAHCGLVCIEHAIYVRTSERAVRHKTCGLNGALRDIVTVSPLGGAS